MVLKLDISGNTFRGVGTVLSLPHGSDAEIKFTDNDSKNCINGIVERDKPSFLNALGLPPDTPADAVLEVIKTIRAAPEASQEEKLEVIKKSKIWTYVERSSSAITVVQGLIAIAGTAIGIPAAF